MCQSTEQLPDTVVHLAACVSLEHLHACVLKSFAFNKSKIIIPGLKYNADCVRTLCSHMILGARKSSFDMNAMERFVRRAYLS